VQQHAILHKLCRLLINRSYLLSQLYLIDEFVAICILQCVNYLEA